MSYLPLIARAGALVVREGSALSHLMQHARRLRVPHVVGADIGDQKDSALVFISASGEVCRA
ncbi:PEP-utilizing enzyme [Pseudomonas aeruginosa]|nr:PEP-utilizing enzyme [Pseudomonas aeruginosa]MCT7339915.1 PEP-utilizing enzyme [Pseudomonas aeruginosa]